MSRRSRSHSTKRSPLLALLFALLLAAAACSGSSEVEVEDASVDADTSEDSEVEASTDDTVAENEPAVEEDAAETEDAAMGEDDAMVDDEVDTTAPAEDEAPESSSATSDFASAELAAAFEAAEGDLFRLPYMYLTVDQDCDGCAETMSLYYVPSEEKASILTLATAYIDGVAQSDFSAVDPSLQAGDPRRIAEQISGTDADYSIDPVSGAITSWTIDGDTVTMRCLQVDTRPVDMRTELCENSVIG